MVNNKEFDMVAEKITVTIPHKLKGQLVALKDELQTSMSTIYKEALEAYIEKKEIEKWQKAAEMANKDKKYLNFIDEIANDAGDLYDYAR